MNSMQQYILLYDAILALLKSLGINIPLPPIPVPASAGADPSPAPEPALNLTPSQQTLLSQHLLAAHMAARVLESP